jgi:hypothetical protein
MVLIKRSGNFMRGLNSIKKQQGQSLTEFALSLVIILFLLVVIVDGARALFTFMALRDAAQEGALYASINPCAIDEIRNHVRQSSDMVSGFNLADGDIAITVDEACTGGGITVQVTIPAFQLTMPFVGTFIGSQTVPISASVIDTVLSPKCPNSCP